MEEELMIKKEIEEVLDKHKEILSEPWLMIVILLIFNCKKTATIEDLDTLLTIIEREDTELLEEEINNE